MAKAICAAVLFVLAGSAAVAQDAVPGRDWLREGQQGWFWYHDPPAEEIVAPVPLAPPAAPPAPDTKARPAAPVPPPPTAVDPPTFSAAWFRAKLDGYRDAAIDDPTPQNVERYLYLQHVMMDKASTFTDAFRQVVATTPYLDANNERPIDSAGANATNEIAEAATTDLVKKLAEKVGLVFFFSSGCAICEQQVDVLEAAQRIYGFSVLAVSLDGKPLPGGRPKAWVVDAGQAHRMGVRAAPAIVLMRPPGEFAGVSESVLSLTTLVERVLLRARVAGWVSDADYQATQPVQKRSLLGLSQEITAEMLEDPVSLSQFLHQRLGGAP